MGITLLVSYSLCMPRIVLLLNLADPLCDNVTNNAVHELATTSCGTKVHIKHMYLLYII